MRLLIAAAAALCAVLPAAHAEGWQFPPLPPALMCDRAIDGVERGSGIPARMLGAIGRVESGRPDPRTGVVRPWPWAINAEGKGTLFETRDEAIAAVVALQARGVSSVDVGCMQINLVHHPLAFATLEQAFDPVLNVRYAVRFLQSLRAETGDWATAAAYYHSRTAEEALPYQRKVLAQVPGLSAPLLPGAAALSVQPVVSALASAWAATLPGQGSGRGLANLSTPASGAAGWAMATVHPIRARAPRTLLASQQRTLLVGHP